MVDILIIENCVNRNCDSILCRVVANIFLCRWKGHSGITNETMGIGWYPREGVLYIMSNNVIKLWSTTIYVETI